MIMTREQIDQLVAGEAVEISVPRRATHYFDNGAYVQTIFFVMGDQRSVLYQTVREYAVQSAVGKPGTWLDPSGAIDDTALETARREIEDSRGRWVRRWLVENGYTELRAQIVGIREERGVWVLLCRAR